MTNFVDFIRSNSSFAKLACDDLLFAEYKCPIKENKYPIWSEANYLAFVLSGKKIWSYNDVSYELKAGDAIFVSKGAHHIEQIMDKEFCVLLFIFPDEFLEEVLEDTNYFRKKRPQKTQKLIPIEVNEPLQIYFQSMASFFSQKLSPSKQLLAVKFRELILQLLNYQNDPTLFIFFDSVIASPEWKFKRLIESNLRFNLSIEEYASIAGMSVSTFKRFFRQVFGDSPGQFIINSRLSFAAGLLKKTSKTVQEIAYESGFENAAHFTRMFNKKFKTSPSKYRGDN
jgi:AraC family transcriptional regulator, exoenzyme S synthesis regulatory protein ExsA